MTESRDREARLDITEVLVRYATGIDRRDWDLFRTCFTPDCHADYEGIGAWEGVDALTEFMVDAHAGMRHTLHRVTNFAIAVADDRAEARTYVDVVFVLADDGTGLEAAGYYDDALVRTADGWRIASRRFTPVGFH
jgi:3-phenylpropionate/cinnamic acid dioxygenase small subunit